MPERTGCERFRAAPDPSGRAAVWMLAALSLPTLAVLSLLTAVAPPPPGPSRVAIDVMNAGSVLLVAALLIGCALAVNRIDYILSENALEIRIGPWRGPVIAFGSILGAWAPEEIRRSGWHSWTGFRMPGLWITTVRPREIGPVALYATRIDRHLVLVKTGARTYGLSPEEPEAFLAALRERMGRA